jgi:ribosomal protein S18 acetylase RimI-like enzyme
MIRELDNKELYYLLEYHDSEFVPRLKFIAGDLDIYSQKLISYGHNYGYFDDNNNCIGFICFYANKINTGAYVSLIFVNSSARNLGIGRSLLDFTSDFAFIRGMKKICLEVYKTNESAIKFYIKNGFIKSKTLSKSFLMTKDI